MSESVIRSGRRHGFTVIQNPILQDRGISLKTKGLYAVMMSLPADWRYSITGLAAKVGVGKDAIRGALQELENAKYLIRETARGEHGKFGGVLYTLYDEPQISPSSGFPTSADPMTADPMTADPTPENPMEQNKQVQTTKEVNTPPIIPQEGGAPSAEKPRRRARGAKSEPNWEPEMFERLWAAYPVHKDRVSAVREWDRLRPTRELMHVMSRALKAQKESDFWRQGKGIPYLCRWLSHQRWADVEPTSGSPPKKEPEWGWGSG